MSEILNRALASFDSLDPPMMLPNVPYLLSHDGDKLKVEAIAPEDYWMTPTYKVRGPDPDGDYFIVHIVDGEETALDETFLTEEEAIVGIEKLEGKA